MGARAFVAALASTLALHGVGAQVRASERSTITQVVDGTTFTIDYSRPRVRGRPQIFGGVVKWGETWTPGANWATTLEVNRDIRLDGHDVPKGKYSVWLIPRQGLWTMVLEPKAQLYHVETPDSSATQIRWRVKPLIAPATELLTWSFPEVRPDGVLLQFQWATTRLVVDAKVTPKHPLTIARADAEPYLGRFDLAWVGEDSTKKTFFELYYENGSIKALYEPDPEFYPSMQRSIMARINDDWFIPAIIRDGTVWEMVADMIYEFRVEKGKAISYEIYDDHDSVMAKGSRVAPRTAR